MTQWTYFAQDGSYGDAKDLVVVDTTNWDDYHWATIALGEGADRFPELAEKLAVDTDSYLIHINAEILSAENEVYVEPIESAEVAALLNGLAAGLSVEDASIYAARIAEVK